MARFASALLCLQAAHEHELLLPEQVALEQLAAFSVLARWIEEGKVEAASAASDASGESSSLSQALGMVSP